MSNQSNPVDEEVDLNELFAALWANKTLIILITSLSIFLAGYYALTSPKKYTAKAIFLIEQENKSGFSLSGEIGALASLAGLPGGGALSESASLIERVLGREFILRVNKKLFMDRDPYFNNYNPDYKDPSWIANIKKLLGRQEKKLKRQAIIENNIIKNYKKAVKVSETDGGAILISVTHKSAEKAAEYANAFMDEIQSLVEQENNEAQNLRLSYLSETLADALQDMERAQKDLKAYVLKNSAFAQENFISGSMKLDEIRMERRKVEDIDRVLSVLGSLVRTGNLDSVSYETLRSDYPLVDDIEFRRILGMSETVSSWTWPQLETLQDVSATLKDRIKRLDVEINTIEENAKIYATSAEVLGKFTRDAKIAEATYTVLIEQVKSQSLADGFRPDTFKVYQYASPPLISSEPRVNIILGLGLIVGVILACAVTLVISTRRGVYYSRAALISHSNAQLTIKSKSIRRISRGSIAKIKLILSKRRVRTIDEAEIKLANKSLIYFLNYGGQPSASGTARLLATQSSSSGRKVVLCDTTGESNREIEGTPSNHSCGYQVAKIDPYLSLVVSANGTSFFTASTFHSTIKDLMDNFDQVIVSSSNKDANLGFEALKEFNPCIVLLAGLRKTRRIDIKRLTENQPIDILLHD